MATDEAGTLASHKASRREPFEPLAPIVGDLP
jgi:hypothetical protein